MKINKRELNLGHVFKKVLSEDHLFKIYVEIYEEHKVYHVRKFKNVKNSSSTDRLSWNSFFDYSEAVKQFESES